MKKNSIILADLDEMIFENRNKTYGGYVIRKDHNKNLASGLAIVTSLLALFVILNFSLGGPNGGPNTEAFIPTILDNYEILEVDLLKKEEIEEPEEIIEEKKEEPAQGITETKFDNLKASTEAADTATIVAMDSIKGNPSDRDMEGNDSTGVIGNPADSAGTGVIPPKKKTPIKGDGDDEPNINDPDWDLEETPSALNMDKLKKEMGYPSAAKEIGIDGKVIFRILVDEKGNYKKHKAIYSSHKIFEKHAAPHLKKLKFKPGVQAGRNVQVWVNIPFKFHLR